VACCWAITASPFLFGLKPVELAAVLGMLTLALVPVARIAIGRVIAPQLSSSTASSAAAWLIAAGAAAIILTVAIPLPVGGPMEWHRLQIINLGLKNPQSEAFDLTVVSIGVRTGGLVPPSELQLNGDWEVRDGQPVSYQNLPASLEWQGRAPLGLNIRVVSHHRSGIVLVRFDGRDQVIDLYRPDAVVREIAVSSPNASPHAATFWSIGLFLVHVVGLGVLCLAVTLWLATRTSRARRARPMSRRAWLAFGAVCGAVWGAYLLAFWPGVMSADSFGQWTQAHTGVINDWHPAFHTMVIRLLTRVWDSPAAVGVAQVIALAGLAGWGLSCVGKLNSPRAVLWVACLATALSPINGVMSVTLWKDIAYTISVVALTIMILEIVRTEGVWLDRLWSPWALTLTAALVALFRHNGPPVAFGSLLLLAICRRRNQRRLLICLAGAGAIWLGIRGPVYTLLKVERVKIGEVPLLQPIVAHLRAGTPLESAEATFLSEVLPPTGTVWEYDCHAMALPLAFKSNRRAIVAHPGRLAHLFLSLTWRNPLVTLRHIVCASSFIWRVRDDDAFIELSLLNYLPPDALSTYLATSSKEAGGVPVHGGPILPTLAPKLHHLLIASASRATIWVVWRPALYLYLFLFALIIASLRRRSWQYLTVGTPVFVHSLVLGVISPSSAVRYQYPVYVIALLLALPLLLVELANDPRVRSNIPNGVEALAGGDGS